MAPVPIPPRRGPLPQSTIDGIRFHVEQRRQLRRALTQLVAEIKNGRRSSKALELAIREAERALKETAEPKFGGKESQ